MHRQGVVCFISNYSWLEGLSFTGMRERYLEAFDKIWIDNLHGDRIISNTRRMAVPANRVRCERTFAGNQDRHSNSSAGQDANGFNSLGVLYRDMDQAKAADRRAALVDGLSACDPDSAYEPVVPAVGIGLPFSRAKSASTTYLGRCCLTCSRVVCRGETSRDEFVVDIDRDRLVKRLEQYFDPAISHEEMRHIAPRAWRTPPDFRGDETRDQLRRRGFLRDNVIRFCYRPFDVRWLYGNPRRSYLTATGRTTSRKCSVVMYASYRSKSRAGIGRNPNSCAPSAAWT